MSYTSREELESDIKKLKTFLNDAFFNAVEFESRTAYQIEASRVWHSLVEFKFVFYPGFASRYTAWMSQIAENIENSLAAIQYVPYLDGKYTLKPGSFEYKIGKSEKDGLPDYFIEGYFDLVLTPSIKGVVLDKFEEIEILYRGDRRRNPGASVLGALIIGGIIGRSMKK